MSVPTCAICPTPLKQTQGVYCSVACRIAAKKPRVRACNACGVTFAPKRTSKRCCSAACADTFRVPKAKPCRGCHQAFTPSQRWRRCCSQRCTNARRSHAETWSNRPSGRLREVVSLFEAVDGQWLTISDIAIWIYGDDSVADRDAVRLCLLRLAQAGYRFDRRAATWERSRGGPIAYRLIKEPAVPDRRAA